MLPTDRLCNARLVIMTAALTAISGMTFEGGCRRRGKKAGSRKRTESNPVLVFESQFEYMRSHKVDLLWSLYSDRMRKESERVVRTILVMPKDKFRLHFGFDRSEIEGRSTLDILKKMSLAPKLANKSFPTPKIERMERRSENELIIKFRQNNRSCRQYLVKEDGVWKIGGSVACKMKMETPASTRSAREKTKALVNAVVSPEIRTPPRRVDEHPR